VDDDPLLLKLLRDTKVEQGATFFFTLRVAPEG
jgi:hypothetical protein